MSLYLTIRTPSAAHCWPVADDPVTRDEQIHRARVFTGFPHGDGWLDPGSGWYLSVSPDVPHHQIAAAQHDVRELSAVTVAQVDAWKAADVAARQGHRVGSARSMVQALTPAEQVLLRNQLGWTAPTGGGR